MDEKKQKIFDNLSRLIMSVSDQIAESMNRRFETNIGLITAAKVTNYREHSGAGGKTYIAEATLQTTAMGQIKGGIVIKIANDVDNEERNARQLHQLLQRRNEEWEELLDQWGHRLPEKIRGYPGKIYAPNVIDVLKERKVIILEFIENARAAINLELDEMHKFSLIGYALARLHGFKQLYPRIELYRPVFKMLEHYVASDHITYWSEILANSKGGVEFIHGDSHLQNLLLSEREINWIDALLLPQSERMDDVGYALSHATQEYLINQAQAGVDLQVVSRKVIQKVVYEWVPAALSTYRVTFNLSGLYQRLPLDFFLGTHLIVRGDLFPQGVLKDTILSLGKYFIEQTPILQVITKK